MEKNKGKECFVDREVGLGMRLHWNSMHAFVVCGYFFCEFVKHRMHNLAACLSHIYSSCSMGSVALWYWQD